jgi:hypothetical protein
MRGHCSEEKVWFIQARGRKSVGLCNGAQVSDIIRMLTLQFLKYSFQQTLLYVPLPFITGDADSSTVAR